MLIIGGLVTIVAALSADLVWLVVIIAPFWSGACPRVPCQDIQREGTYEAQRT